MNNKLSSGKRSGNSMKRTTSVTGGSIPIISNGSPSRLSPLPEFPKDNFVFDENFLSLLSPTSANSGRFPVAETAPFLRFCCLCNRGLAPARDIYMYRGDTAFCSENCREKQMKLDERQRRLNMVAAKKQDLHSSSTTTTSTTAAPPSTETVVAA
ncbi:hypothetical protein ERO13_A11G199800v2 [Gossypium hirsutum]|uniref:Protein INCREASED RESISTANCE TO MYZUS PERSICAE 1 n=1 Tax=Gossypium hirsutum TaxID=3635 RepID=A0A1U8MM06_GOSHI|nr:protein INCREASED RESISTANCE TO MYZUS PERSICAE 1-like [Gossypium hirsutum]KAG4175690.1 hypothetical protein ERO13_A11G199800v2 [Gossypium hirsutum]